jgi:Spy/CpxP family protein refolding chaperone
MIRILLLVIALVSTGGVDISAQTRGPEHGGIPDSGPVHMLLEFKDELKLTPAQIQQLGRIDAEMERANQPLVHQLGQIRRKIRELGPLEKLEGERRARFDTYLAEARPLMDRIQENNWAAMQKVGDVLTGQQKERVARYIRELVEDGSERSGSIPQLPRRGN